MNLSNKQIEALEHVGAEIADGWIDACATDEAPDLDYDFGARGDWDLVRDAAISLGCDCTCHDEIWSAVKAGYREKLLARRES
jgi:hypothetical protein